MIKRWFSGYLKMFQAGPVQTSSQVKESVLIDYGSRDPNFGKQVEDIKSRILRFAKLDTQEFACVLMQGPPSYITESIFSTIKPENTLLLASNGTIGEEMADISKILQNNTITIKTTTKLEPSSIIDKINSNISHVAIVHEETSGLLNPVNSICKAIKNKNKDITTIVNGSSAYD